MSANYIEVQIFGQVLEKVLAIVALNLNYELELEKQKNENNKNVLEACIHQLDSSLGKLNNLGVIDTNQ